MLDAGEGSDAPAGAGVLYITGGAAVTEASDMLLVVGGNLVVAEGRIAEDPDAATSTGLKGIVGAGATSEADDSVASAPPIDGPLLFCRIARSPEFVVRLEVIALRAGVQPARLLSCTIH